MKLKKIFAFMLSILFVAALSAQTKKVATNKLIQTLEKNTKTGVTFVSDINLNGIEVLENQTLVIPSLKNETINFVAKIDTEFLIERIKYNNSQFFKVEFVLQNENTKTYEITKIHNIETVKEYNTRIETERQANLQKLPVQVINYEITNLNISESSWLPSQIQDKFKSNLQSYLGMKTVVDSKAESALKKLQAESENVGRDENTAIELGKITTAKFALFTKIRKVGANYVIAVDFTDLTTGEQMASCMSKEYSKAEYLYGNTGAVDELTLALAEKLGIKVSELNKNYLTSGSASFSVDEQLALAKENEAKFNQMMANYDAELAKLTTSNDINAIQNKKRIEAEKALLQEKQNAEKKRQAELQAQKERAESDKKLEAERSIALKTQRDKLAQDAAAKASEVRKLKMEKQGVLGQINVVESKKKALIEIRQGVENRSIELYNQLEIDIKSEFERITNKSYSTVELGSDGKPTEQALTRRENQRIAKYDELHQKFYADCESVKQATMSQQNALLQEIKQDQTNLAKIKTVNSMGDELKVSFGPYEGSKNGWNAYLSLYSDGILVYTDTVIVSYEAVAGKKAPNMETELNDAVIEEYTNNVDMYNSLLTRGDPILYFEIEYSVNAKDQDHPSEYDFTYTNLKVHNTLSDKVVQNIALNKTESKVMNPKQDLRIYDGIVENAKENVKTVKKYLENSWKIDKIFSSIITYKSLQFVDIFDIGIKMSKTEVTQDLYELVMGENPSYFQGTKNLPAEGENQSKRPVENVSWYDAIYFCNKLSVIFGLDPVYSVDGETDVTKWDYVPHRERRIRGKLERNLNANGYRLPTDTEWGIAAIDYGDFDTDEKAWYEKNSNFITHEVGKKKANRYGLFDIGGNVWEWCYRIKIFIRDKEYDAYGGSWDSSRNECEGLSIYSYPLCQAEKQYDNIGFRIVCSQE